LFEAKKPETIWRANYYFWLGSSNSPFKFGGSLIGLGIPGLELGIPLKKPIYWGG